MTTEPLSPALSARPSEAAPRLEVQRVAFDAPWDWLAAGWRDLWSEPTLSLGYGAVFTAVIAALLFGLSHTTWQALVLVFAGGLLILGPLFALGLYEISRRRERGETVTADVVIGVRPRSTLQLAYIGFALLFLFGVWLRVAFILFAIFFGSLSLPPIERFVPELLFTSHGLGMLIVGTLVGGALAAVAFMISAISLPLLMANQADAMTAMWLSAKAVLDNPRAMALWAVLIAATMASGLATMLFGLIVAFPLVGHATWHAYRALIRDTR